MTDALQLEVTRVRGLIEAAYGTEGWQSDAAVCAAVDSAIDLLDRGVVRVASPPAEAGGDWQVHPWVKQAVLMYFGIAPMQTMEAGVFSWHDKIPLKADHAGAGIRTVPPAAIRRGAFVEPGAILMPSYVNIGAWVGAGSMVDTWATVGSCAQIGRGVHLSGGVGIGGVLEPPGATPVIIEDGAFIGSRAIVVEGVRVESEAVLGANVVLTASTPIIDVTGPEEVIYKGRVPARSVVVPGTRAKDFPAGTYHLSCALIIGQRKESTDRKTSLNDVLRSFAVSV
jgi:2,3,4,5-tetrahydropyridine-2-carboxylate N-succinyltransferase